MVYGRIISRLEEIGNDDGRQHAVGAWYRRFISAVSEHYIRQKFKTEYQLFDKKNRQYGKLSLPNRHRQTQPYPICFNMYQIERRAKRK